MRGLFFISALALAAAQDFNLLPADLYRKCNLIGQGKEMHCCRPAINGGCDAPVRMFPIGQVPQAYTPPPAFLRAVCCQKTEECCPKDTRSRFPTYTCCKYGSGCVIADNKGTCKEGVASNGTTPNNVHQVDSQGRCPSGGALPILAAQGLAQKCSLNSLFSGSKCPTDYECVRDISNNVNSGVCCRTSKCSAYTSCSTCVKNAEKHPSPCGWLSQGDLDNTNPRCVAACKNFPDKSCVLPSTDARLCPKTVGGDDVNGTVVNTGSCNRRCSYVGTGRSAGINNDGNKPAVSQSVNATDCCKEFPGDYCCDAYGKRAAHCGAGVNLAMGAMCGHPLRGSNVAYNQVNSINGGVYGPRPFAGLRPYPFVPRPYGGVYGFGRFREGEVDAEEENKQLFFSPAPIYFPAARPNKIPTVVDQQPTAFVCSCDSQCTVLKDCCSDYVSICAPATTTD